MSAPVPSKKSCGPAKSGGNFKDLEQFLSRSIPRIVNRKTLESLVKAGAFRPFTEHDAISVTLLHNMDAMLAYANRVQKDAKQRAGRSVRRNAIDMT